MRRQAVAEEVGRGVAEPAPAPPAAGVLEITASGREGSVLNYVHTERRVFAYEVSEHELDDISSLNTATTLSFGFLGMCISGLITVAVVEPVAETMKARVVGLTWVCIAGTVISLVICVSNWMRKSSRIAAIKSSARERC
jgi:hypothetical protein